MQESDSGAVRATAVVTQRARRCFVRGYLVLIEGENDATKKMEIIDVDRRVVFASIFRMSIRSLVYSVELIRASSKRCRKCRYRIFVLRIEVCLYDASFHQKLPINMY